MSLLESDLQTAIFTWAATMEREYPELRWLHAVPNGGRRDAKEATMLKRQGVKAGILDISLDVARGEFHGFKMELKKPGSTEKPTKEQYEYIDFCIAEGYYVCWTNDFATAKQNIMQYLQMPKFGSA